MIEPVAAVLHSALAWLRHPPDEGRWTAAAEIADRIEALLTARGTR